MKLSWMAIDPRKPQKFNPAEVKAYTVVASRLKASPGSISLCNRNCKLSACSSCVSCIACPVGMQPSVKLFEPFQVL